MGPYLPPQPGQDSTFRGVPGTSVFLIGTLGRHNCWRRERFSSCRAWISFSKLRSSFSRGTWEHKRCARGASQQQDKVSCPQPLPTIPC